LLLASEFVPSPDYTHDDDGHGVGGGVVWVYAGEGGWEGVLCAVLADGGGGGAVWSSVVVLLLVLGVAVGCGSVA